MIRFKFLGGLGNQMFQYAFYLRLKEQYSSANILLDFDSYRYEKFHTGFRLEQIFDLPINSGIQENKWLTKIWYKLLVNLRKYYYIKLHPKSIISDSSPFDVIDNISISKAYFVQGTWNSETYFFPVKELVRTTYSIRKDILSAEIVKIANRIKKENSIFIHIRRGDYVNSGFVSLTDTEYYKNAVEKLKKESDFDQLLFYVFSDDIKWCKINVDFLPIDRCSFIEGNKDYEDLYLMQNCKSAIIANSTFSWWGGYLSGSKRVLAPKYIRREHMDSGFYDQKLYPSQWTVIDC